MTTQTTTTAATATQLPMKVKLGYMYGEYIYSYLVFAFLTYFIFFLTDIVGISPAVAGTIFLIGMVWDAITDPIIGHITDNAKFKSGRRRPFILLSGLPFAIAGVLMFTNIDYASDQYKVIHFVVVILLFYTMATTYYISFQALGAEMTSDFKERARLMSIKSAMISIGCTVAASGTYFLVAQFSDALGESMAWTVAVGILASVGVILSWICVGLTKGYEHSPEVLNANQPAGAKQKHNYVALFKDVSQNRPFLYVTGIMLLVCIAGFGSSVMIIYYMTYNIGLTEGQVSLAFLIQGITGVISAPVANKLLPIVGRRKSYHILMGIWALGFLGFLLLGKGDVMEFYMLYGLWGFGWISLWSLIYTMIADVVIVDEYKTGRKREGLYYGVTQLFQKASSGVATWFIGLALTFAGYVANQEQPQSSLDMIKYLTAIMPAVFIALSMLLMIKYPLTKERYLKISDILEKRKKGEDHGHDVSELDRVL